MNRVDRRAAAVLPELHRLAQGYHFGRPVAQPDFRGGCDVTVTA